MTDVEKARHLFQEAGLAFPTIPQELAVGLKEQGKWLFSTRKIDMSPYNLQHYVHEVDGSHVEDYAVVSHSGHGTNSYAIQYYLVYGPLCMFLHLGWGGVYMDADAAASKIQECFSLADEIVPTVLTVGQLGAGEGLTIVGSDFYGSYWSAPGQSRQKERRDSKGPAEVLTEVLHWLKSPPPNSVVRRQRRSVSRSFGGSTMLTVWDRVRGLEGATLTTLYRPKSFTVVAVEDDCVRIVPTDGIGTERPIRRDRIEYIAGLGLPREELRRRTLREFPHSRNTSYIAAIVHAVSCPVRATVGEAAPVGGA